MMKFIRIERTVINLEEVVEFHFVEGDYNNSSKIVFVLKNASRLTFNCNEEYFNTFIKRLDNWHLMA